MSENNSKITSVTVYRDRAMVTRLITKKFEIGEHTVLFDFLPNTVVDNSVQVKGTGNAMLKDTKVKTIFTEEHPNEEIKELNEQVLNLQDQMKELDDKESVVNNEKEFIQNMAEKTTSTEAKSKTDLDIEKWKQMIEFYRTRLDELNHELREMTKSKRHIQNKMDIVLKLLKQYNSPQVRSRKAVEVNISVSEENEVNLFLSYIVTGASWQPIYDLRTDSETKKMTFYYNALVRQNTGENWENVLLKLSTAKPSVSGTQPMLNPWYVNVYTPYPGTETDEEEGNMKREKKKMSPKTALSKGLAAMTKTDMDSFVDLEPMEVVVETGATSVVFVIQTPGQIPSDNIAQKVCILTNVFDVEFDYSSTPKLSPFAFLKAKVKNNTDFPFLPGETAIFLDNSYVTASSINMVAPTETFETSLGIDESVKIEYKFINKFNKDEGIFTKKQKIICEYHIIIKNNRKTAEKIRILDQIPISQNQDIIVELIEPKYKEDTEALKKNSLQMLEWRAEIKPGEELKIPLKFSVEYPRDITIHGI